LLASSFLHSFLFPRRSFLFVLLYFFILTFFFLFYEFSFCFAVETSRNISRPPGSIFLLAVTSVAVGSEFASQSAIHHSGLIPILYLCSCFVPHVVANFHSIHENNFPSVRGNSYKFSEPRQAIKQYNAHEYVTDACRKKQTTICQQFCTNASEL
jgi:hypothetical protein